MPQNRHCLLSCSPLPLSWKQACSLSCSILKLQFQTLSMAAAECVIRPRLDDLGWTDFCDSIKNSWGTRGMYCQRDQSATLSFPFQVDQRFCDGAAVSSGSFQFMTLLIKTLQPEEKETLRVAGSVLKLFIPYHEQWVSLGKANLCITYSWSQLWKASFFLL